MLTKRRVLAARVLAVVADAVQLGFLPLFAEGVASIVNDVLDVVIAAVMVALVGWHWVFAPALVAELVPVVDLAPTWTIAVFIATWRWGTASPGSPTKSVSPGESPSPTGPPRALPPGNQT